MSTDPPESNAGIPPDPSTPSTDACAPVTTGDPDLVLVPFLGWVPRPNGDWQPTKPGPQKCNAGVPPRRPLPQKPRVRDRVSDLELALNEAMLRLAVLEAEVGGRDRA